MAFGTNKTIAIFPGHLGKDSGAIAKDGTKESDLTRAISFMIVGGLNQLSIKFIWCSGSLDDRIYKSKGCDFGMSLHCDAFTDGNANGLTLFHYPGSSQGVLLATVIEKEMLSLGKQVIKSRGIKPMADFFIIRKTAFPTVLFEMGFITNESDLALLKNRNYQAIIAHAVVTAIAKLCV